MCKTVTIVNRLHVAEAECNNNQIKKPQTSTGG